MSLNPALNKVNALISSNCTTNPERSNAINIQCNNKEENQVKEEENSQKNPNLIKNQMNNMLIPKKDPKDDLVNISNSQSNSINMNFKFIMTDEQDRNDKMEKVVNDIVDEDE